VWVEARADGWSRPAFGDTQRASAALTVTAGGPPRLLLADAAGNLVFQTP